MTRALGIVAAAAMILLFAYRLFKKDDAPASKQTHPAE